MESATTSKSTWVLGAIVVAFGVAGVTAIYVLRNDPSFDQPVAAAVEQLTPPEIEVLPTPDAVPGGVPLDDPSPLVPAFDTVRVDPDGQSLIAGSAAPDARVEALLNGQLIGEARADSNGQFVIFGKVPAGDGVRIMWLRAMLGDQTIEGTETILVEPVARPPLVADLSEEDVVEPAEPPGVSTSQERDAELEDVLVAEAPDIEEATPVPEPEPEPEPTPEAPRLLLTDERGVSVVQSPEAMSSVALDTITYSEAGDVSLGGRALGEGFVRIYIDDDLITTSPIESDGSWRTALPGVDTGVYQLRVDELDAEGQVTSRIETPFRREDPAVVAQLGAPEQETGPILQDVMTVQPGATLWAIARDRYGEGQLYVKVFEANSDRIRDPDLIFPGQVFDLPE